MNSSPPPLPSSPFWTPSKVTFLPAPVVSQPVGRIFILLLPLLTEDEDETETAKGETNAVDKEKFAAA